MIYFIQGQTTRAIKIGKANDPAARLKGLQTGMPETLALLGTVPGHYEEERLLHGQFERFHLRGEWFHGEPELFRMIMALAAREGTPSTLWDECRRRDGCRIGLPNKLCSLRGDDRAFRVYHTDWNADSEIVVSLYPEHEYRPKERWKKRDGLLRIGSDYLGTDYPPGFMPAVSPRECVLLEQWPITCCEPGEFSERFRP